MIVSYFSVWDKKARAFGQLFPSNTKGSAERSFADNVNSSDSTANKYPEDFTLFQICDFDDDSGSIANCYEPPLLICEATALKR